MLSTFFSDCDFQLLLDFQSPHQCLGHKNKTTPLVKTFDKADADELTLITTNSKDMKFSVDETVKWLKWTQTMKAKPSKCISLGFKLFDKRIKNEKFTPLSLNCYAPFDPWSNC
jgi:hypothetical protein